MFMFRLTFMIAFALIVLWWPLNYLLSFLLFKRRVSRVAKNMRTVDGYPLFGAAFRFMGKNNEEIMEVVKDFLLKYKTPIITWLGPKAFITIDDPDDIQAVINAKGCIEKGDIYRFFNRIGGLLSAPYHIWKTQRKQLSVSFNNQVTLSFLPIFNQKSSLLVRNVGQHVGKGSFNILEHSSACSLDIFLETALGSNMGIQDGENSDYKQALDEWLSAVARRMSNVFMHSDLIYKQTQLYRTESDWLARSEVLPEKLMVQKMLEFNRNIKNNDEVEYNEEEEDDEAIVVEKPQILIDRLLKLHHRGIISDEEIRQHVHFVILGGHDTSAYTVALTTLMLAMHPKEETRVMDELNEVLGDQPVDSDLTLEQVNQLVYLEQAIKETLRLYPPVPLLFRHCTEDTPIKDSAIPKDTEVVISVISAQRRTDVWGMDADEYKPERFSKEASANRSPYAYMVFSNGPRNCPGQRFAYLSIKIIMAKLLRKYRFSTHLGMEDIKFRLEITCKPINGVTVEVEERI